MYKPVISELLGVRIINKYEFICNNPIDAICVIERIIRVGKKQNTRIITPRCMQNTLYRFASMNGSGGYHGFYETMNWDAACSSIYNSFGVDSIFVFELYARWRRIKLIVDNEQVGGMVDDGLIYLDSDIHLTSVEGGWHIEVMYDLID